MFVSGSVAAGKGRSEESYKVRIGSGYFRNSEFSFRDRHSFHDECSVVDIEINENKRDCTLTEVRPLQPCASMRCEVLRFL